MGYSGKDNRIPRIDPGSESPEQYPRSDQDQLYDSAEAQEKVARISTLTIF